MSNSISIDQKSFKRIAKRLKKEISNLDENSGLMKIQEIMAQSLGFRNAHDIENYFNKASESNNHESEKNYDPFRYGSAGRITEILIRLSAFKNNEHSEYKGTAISLLSAVARALVWLRDNQSEALNFVKFNNALSFENVVLLSQNDKLPYCITSDMHGYLVSIPGFVFSDQNKDNLAKGKEQHNILLDILNIKTNFDNFKNKYQNLSDKYSSIEITEFSDNIPFKIRISMANIKILQSQAKNKEEKDIYQRLQDTINDSYVIEKMLGHNSNFISY